MSRLEVMDAKGAPAGEVEIRDELLVRDRGEQAVHDVVRSQRAAARAGTASTRGKSEVAGSGAKPWRQKGTGRARAGYRQSPVWRGGAVAFGPKPRSFAGKVNRKVARLAFRRALSDRLADGAVRVIDTLDLPEPRTRLLAERLEALGLAGRRLLVLTGGANANLALAARNLPRVELARAGDVNVYQLLRYRSVLADRAGMDVLAKRLGDGGKEAA